MAKKIMVTYSIVTSAAEFFAVDGYIDVPTGAYISSSEDPRKARGQLVRTVEQAAAFITQEGSRGGWVPPMPSSTSYHHGIWYSYRRIRGGNYGKVKRAPYEEERSYHPEGFSLSEERRLYDQLVGWKWRGD